MFITQLYLIAYGITPCRLTGILATVSRLVIVITTLSPLNSFLESVLTSSIL